MLIKRLLFQELKSHLPKREITFIVGPRQVGKTTLMLSLKDYLETQRKKTLFLSLDFERDQEFFLSQSRLVEKIQLELGKSKGYVFIDEIQRKKNAGLFLKGIYDMNLPYKLIVSGSGSVELKERIHESLIGRKRIFELNPVSFKEFVDFKTQYRYNNRLSEFFCIERGRTKELLLEYLNFGGYPRVVTEESLQEKKRTIDEIYRSYIERDIVYLLKVEKTAAFSSLVKLLADQIGGLINYSELSSTLGISTQTVKSYLNYLEKTFIVRKITPYFKNIRKEISKSPMIYFCDLGLRNYSLGLFGNLEQPSEIGLVFQNFIFNILKERYFLSSQELHFWRTKDKAEVDLIIELGKKIIPVEIKYKQLKIPKIERALCSFISKYQPKDAWIINLSLERKIKIKKTLVHFLPFHKITIDPLPD
jgi:hypothetical protein